MEQEGGVHAGAHTHTLTHAHAHTLKRTDVSIPVVEDPF